MNPAPSRAWNRAQLFSTSPFPFHDGCWLKHPLHFMHMLVTFCPAVLPLPLSLHFISMSSALVAAFHFILLLLPLPVTIPPQLPHPAAFCPSASFHFSQFCFIPLPLQLLFPPSTFVSTLSTSGYASDLSSSSFCSFPLLLPVTLLFQSTSASISFCFISLPVTL